MADNLPFQNPGKTLLGDARAQDLLPEAKRQMYLVKLFAETAGVQNYRRYTTFADGSRIIASTQSGIERVLIDAAPRPVEEEEEESSRKMNRLAWLPEGFVLTPKSVASPNGFGMPPTEDGLGTPGGPLKQVIVNRYESNLYPDLLASELADPQDASVRTFCAAPIFFMDWEMTSTTFGVGLWRGGEFLPQFTARWVPNYKEVETATWYCHRPMYALNAERTVHQVIREETNMVRAAAGKPAVGQQIRGFEGMLSELVTFLDDDARVLGHDSPKFRDGHKDFAIRTEFRSGQFYDIGENVHLTTSTATTSTQYAVDAVQSWRASPAHYANMIADWATGGAYASVDTAVRLTSNSITERQLPPYSPSSPTEVYDPPINGSLAAQIYTGMMAHVEPSLVGQPYSGDVDAVGIPMLPQGHAYFSPFLEYLPAAGPGVSYVTFKGRTITVDANATLHYTPLAAKMMDNDPKKLRVMCLERTAGDVNADSTVVLFEGLAHDFLATRTTVARFKMPDLTGRMSIPKFSASGERVVFSYSLMEEQTCAYYDAAFSSPGHYYTPGDVDAMWGETIKFRELVGGAFVEIHSASLDIAASTTLPGGGGAFYTAEWVCDGEYRFLADFDGEDLVYAKVGVDSSVYVHRAGAAGTERVSIRGELRFPNTTTHPFIATDSDGQIGGAPYDMAGFIRHYLYLDIVNPGRNVFVEYTAAENGTAASTCSAEVKSDGTIRRTKTEVFRALHAIGSPADQTVLDNHLALRASGNYRYSPYWGPSMWPFGAFTFNISGVSAIAYTSLNQEWGSAYGYPSSDFKATLTGARDMGNSAPVVLKGRSTISNAIPVGPTIVNPFVQSGVKEMGNQCRVVSYRNETLAAVRFTNSLGPDDCGWGDTAANNDAQYSWWSSLPMRAIVGMPYVSMHDNILPIGAL